MNPFRSPALYVGILIGFVAGFQPWTWAEGLKIPESSMLVEFALGQGRYDRAPDGMWWQADRNNQNTFKDNGARQLRIGVRLNPVYTVYIGAVNLGRAHTRATAVTTPGDDATKRDFSKDVQRAECKVSFNGDNCEYHWVGDGGATRALSASVGADLFTWRSLRLEGEAGLLLYRMRWDETVCPNDCRSNDDWRVQVSQHTGYYISPMLGARVHADRCFGLLPERATCFVGAYYYARISDHLPISAGVGKAALSWFGGIQVSL